MEKFICPYCGKECKNKGGLGTHMRNCKANPNYDYEEAKKFKEKMSNIVKNDWQDAEFRQRKLDGMRQAWDKEETHQHLSESLKQTYSNIELRQLKSIIQKNKWLDETYRNYMMSILTSEECRNKISQRNIERFQREEEREKISEAFKRLWSNTEFRQRMLEILNTDEHKEKLSIASKRVWNNLTLRLKQSDTQKQIWEIVDYKQKMIDIFNSDEVRQKSYNTKKKNNSFNTSRIETELKNYFDSNNIEYITQYKSDLYPFMCDFYFPSKDLYVEIQGLWTHGGKPYISTDETCIEQLELWKSKNTDFYNNAIDTWTKRDVKKRNTAKMNNLNWVEVFSNKLDVCLKIILNKLYNM